ncbi:MAG TPA: helicase-related protein, partial [Acetobacteraceae bacterium]
GRTMLGMGVGSGKTSIALSAFTHLQGKGKAKRGLFAVPSIVQGQFHGEALTLLEAGKFNWHCDPGASRAERIAALKDPKMDFNVVTHQSLRDDLLHLASQREGTTPDAVAEKLDAMKPAERKAYMRGVMEAEGIHHDYMAVDEGHTLLNRQGKDNSRMANVLDGVAHGMGTYVSMTADPVKNDASEAFDVLSKMDPDRYSDRDAFTRKYGVDTPAAKDGLKREMARHFYTGSIDPGVKAHRTEVPVELDPAQHEHLGSLDSAAAAARLARMKGGVDVNALKTLSPGSFSGADPATHEEIGQTLNRSIGILHNTAVHHALSGASKTEAVAKLARDRKGRPGVVFCHHLDRVKEIEARLKADGHRVVTLTGGDSSKEKDRKKREYQDGHHDVIVMSDAGAVGANLQRGKWLAQYDTPMTAMVHAQRNGRIHRMGQTEDVELLDVVANHAAERRGRKRLAEKYELRSIMTSPLEGLDDTGVAGYLSRARAGTLDAAAPLHPSVDPAPAAGGWRPTDASEKHLPGARTRETPAGGQEVHVPPAPEKATPEEQGSMF